MRGGRGAEAAAAERERANGPGCGGGSLAGGCDAKRDGMRRGEEGAAQELWGLQGLGHSPAPSPRGLPGL